MRIANVLSVLFLLVMPAVSFAADEEAVSGVVVPKVSKLEGVVSSENPRVEEFSIPTRYSSPFGLGIDAKDRIWFTEMAGNSLAVFDPSTGELKEYRIPSTKDLPEVDWEYNPQNRQMPEKTVTNYSVGNPGNLIIAKDGTIWFVMQLGNSIGKFDPVKEEFTEFMLPAPGALPYDIAEGADGRIWFIEKNIGKIGYLDRDKEKLGELKLEDGANPMGMAVDDAGNVWLAEVNGNYIGRFDPKTKKFRRFVINVPHAQPGFMRFDKGGKLWFCQLRTRQLGVFMPEVEGFSVADIPGYNTVPQSLAPAKDDKVWFLDSMLNRIGYFDTLKLDWKIFSIPTGNAQPMTLGIDSSGDIWFTESGHHANKIGRLVRSTINEEAGEVYLGPAGEHQHDASSAEKETVSEPEVVKPAESPALESEEMEKAGHKHEEKEDGSFPYVVGGLILLALVALVAFRRKSGSR